MFYTGSRTAACFNFTALDQDCLAELEKLTHAGFLNTEEPGAAIKAANGQSNVLGWERRGPRHNYLEILEVVHTTFIGVFFVHLTVRTRNIKQRLCDRLLSRRHDGGRGG